MYRIITSTMPLASLAIMLRSLDWFDPFHLISAVAVIFTATLLALWVRHRRRRGLQVDEADAVTEDTPSPGLLRGLVIGAACSLVLAGYAFGAVRALQATPLYSLWSDADLRAFGATLQTLADAENYEKAAQLARERLAQPLSSRARDRLAQQLVHCLTQAGKLRRDSGDLDGACQLLSEGVRTAEAHGLSPDLPAVLAKEVQEAISFHKHLNTLQQSAKWDELLTTVEQRMTVSDKDVPWLVPLNVQALIHMGIDPNRPIEDRLSYLQRAVDIAVKYGRDASEARRELARLAGQTHFEAQVDQLCQAKRYDEAANLLRLAIAHSPREQWPLPLDRLLYDTLLSHARSMADPNAQKDKYSEAADVARKYNLDGSVATAALDRLEAVRQRDQRAREAAAAQKNARELQQQAESSRREAEAARRKWEQMIAQMSPCRLDAGARAGIAHIDTHGHPVLLVDMWIVKADGSPCINLEKKDFRATFDGLPAEVTSARIPAKRRERDIRIALVMDASTSMTGIALEEAKKGAAEFIGSVPSQASVTVIWFASSVQTACEFSENRQQLREAVDRITASGQTALYQAINYAATQLTDTATSSGRPTEARFIVLLSDGRDTVGGLRVEEALANCQRADAQVYAIGLKSADLDSSLLRRLASETRGAYLEAGNADQLAQQFRVASVEIQRERYRLALIVPSERRAGKLSITIGAAPNDLTVSDNVDCSKVDEGLPRLPTGYPSAARR